MNKSLDKISNIAALEDLLSLPTEAAVKMFSKLEGDIMFLGIGGKIGPTLAKMAKRACDQAGVEKLIYGVSLFESDQQRKQIEDIGIETIHGDLLDMDFIKSLPKAKNVFFLAGMKFGSEENISLTWAVNSYMPALVAEHAYPVMVQTPVRINDTSVVTAEIADVSTYANALRIIIHPGALVLLDSVEAYLTMVMSAYPRIALEQESSLSYLLRSVDPASAETVAAHILASEHNPACRIEPVFSVVTTNLWSALSAQGLYGPSYTNTDAAQACTGDDAGRACDHYDRGRHHARTRHRARAAAAV